MKKLSIIVIAMFIIALVGNVRWTKSKAQQANPPAPVGSFQSETFEKLISIAKSSGSVRVIIGLHTSFSPEGSLNESDVQKQRSNIKQVQKEFLERMISFRVIGIKRFDYIPFLAFETDANELERMKNDPSISSIQEDGIGKGALAESMPIVGAPAAWNSGFTGAGQTVAVIDSGVDKNHTFLAGKVISEACFSSNVTGSSTSVCPGGVTESTASNSGIHCPNSVNGCAHGTNVAGIAAGRCAAFSGVAKDANIIAIQIYSRFENAGTCGGPAPCGRYWTSDMIKGLERVKALSDTIDNIAAVNLSMQTGQQFVSNCDAAHAATKAAIDNLRSVGIPTIICSGNFSFTNALTAPACISTSISVGSVDDGSLGTTADVVSNFSDSSPLLHLLAPGRWINSSIPDNAFQSYFGTSMSAPHVAGAFAILKQRAPDATHEKILETLIQTGLPVTDTRNGVVKPRIRIDAALQAIAKSSGFDYDGDGKADFTVAMTFGELGDKLAPADFDGDGKTDVAVFRPSNGTWYWHNSGSGTFQTSNWGQDGDIPVPADHDNDGKADLIIYRPSNGTWYKRRSADGFFEITQFGTSEDKPQVGDFDGDGKADLVVFRPSDSTWYFLRTAAGFTAQTWGQAGDIPVPADYDGDGKTDVAVFRPSTGQWYRVLSTGNFDVTTWGENGDKPVAADYDGDGKADIAVFRPSNATWYFVGTMNGIGIIPFGTSEDRPTPSAFVY